MPIWLRNFTLNEIIKYRQEEKKSIDNASKTNNSTSANLGDPIPDHIKSKFKQVSKQADYISKKAKK
jgi:hypothetical protein